MFGNLFGDVVNLAGSVVDKATDTAVEFIENPVGKTVEVVTQPLRDGLDVVDGLTEGELRVTAAARLGADVVSGMALGELISWYGTLK